MVFYFFFSSRRRHTRCSRDWSSDVCSSDLRTKTLEAPADAVKLGQRTRAGLYVRAQCLQHGERCRDRKSTRLNSSHGYISYAVFCLKKKKKKNRTQNI